MLLPPEFQLAFTNAKPLARKIEMGKISRESTTILLATRVATRYPRSVRNIFYIIGVIVVIVIVLKVLHLF
jgi:hypothetical protein